MLTIPYKSKTFSPFSEFLFELEDDFNNGSSLDFFTPKNDVIEANNSYRIDLYVPAFKKEEFKITLDDRILSIEGERVLNKELKYNVKESSFGKFKKIYTLPKNIDTNEITSTYVDGVLQITIPKKEVMTSKLIEIK